MEKDQTVTISIEEYTKLIRDSIELEYQKKWQKRIYKERNDKLSKEEIDFWNDKDQMSDREKIWESNYESEEERLRNILKRNILKWREPCKCCWGKGCHACS